MRTLSLLVVVLGAGLAFGEEAPAPLPGPAVSSGQRWSVVSPRTAGQGGSVLEAGLGWPGLWVGFLHGVTPQFDLGVRGTFTYGLEGTIAMVLPGMKVNLLTKVRLLDTGKVSLGVVFEPGPLFSAYPGGYVAWGFSLPIGLRLGIHPVSALTIGVTFDLPFWVQFGWSSFNVPILTGLGAEYFVDSSLLLFFRTKMGPTISQNSIASFTFDATIGLGWKL